jgi:hypothetical protein
VAATVQFTRTGTIAGLNHDIVIGVGAGHLTDRRTGAIRTGGSPQPNPGSCAGCSATPRWPLRRR